jgi:hypothetical protein
MDLNNSNMNTYREQLNYRLKIHYYSIKDINKRLRLYEINNYKNMIDELNKNYKEIRKKLHVLTYSLIFSNMIIIYLLFRR